MVCAPSVSQPFSAPPLCISGSAYGIFPYLNSPRLHPLAFHFLSLLRSVLYLGRLCPPRFPAPAERCVLGFPHTLQVFGSPTVGAAPSVTKMCPAPAPLLRREPSGTCLGFFRFSSGFFSPLVVGLVPRPALQLLSSFPFSSRPESTKFLGALSSECYFSSGLSVIGPPRC